MAARPWRPRGRGLATSPQKSGVVVRFNAGKGSIEHFPSRNDDNIETWGDLSAPENLTAQAFSAISIDCRSNLPRGRNAQPLCRSAIGQHEQRHEPAVHACPIPVNALKLWSATNPLGGGQCLAAQYRLPADG